MFNVFNGWITHGNVNLPEIWVDKISFPFLPTTDKTKVGYLISPFILLFFFPYKQITKTKHAPAPLQQESFMAEIHSSMADFFFFFFLFLFLFLLFPPFTSATIDPPPPPPPPCQNNCGSLPVKYPFGTGYGCGSPRFYPSVTCSSDQLIFTSHAGSYPISSISYTTSTLTITPPTMSTCYAMHSSPNFGLDWSSPFQLGPSLFVLLACQPPTSSLTSKGNPICDSSYNHLCTSLHTCSPLVSLGLPIFSPTNTCCVYSPANLNSKGDLDLKEVKCAAYSSVISLGDIPTDPNRWEYGITLKYNEVGLDNYYNVAMICNACENSDGVCGYAPPRNDFVCVCKNGNSSTDCYNIQASNFWSSGSVTRVLPLSLLLLLLHACIIFLFS